MNLRRSHNLPTETSRITDLIHEAEDSCSELTYTKELTSQIGQATIYVGRAALHAESLHIDVPALAGVLRDEGVEEERLSSLAVVVHDKNDRPKLAKHLDTQLHGWYISSENLVMVSETDKEHLHFPNAIHVVAGHDGINHTLLHEAGHMRNFFKDEAGEILYDQKNVSRLKKLGKGFAAVSAVGMSAGIGSFHNPYLQAGAATICGIGSMAGFVANSSAESILWKLSSEEKSAERFAEQYAHKDLLLNKPHPDVAQLIVEEGDLVSLKRAQFS